MPDGLDSTFAAAVEVILAWVEAKVATPLPPEAKRLEDFELDCHGQQQVFGVSMRRERLWSLRFIQPDAPYRDRPAVGGTLGDKSVRADCPHQWRRTCAWQLTVTSNEAT